MSSSPRDYDCRVRSLTDSNHVSFTTIRKRKLLPNKGLFTGIKKGGDFPKVSRKCHPACMGFFMELLLKKMIKSPGSWDSELNDVISNTMRHGLGFVSRSGRYCPIPQEEFLSRVEADMEYFNEFESFVFEEFIDENPIFDAEIVSDGIAGHPDMICGDTVYDVKTSGNFGAMRTSTVLQLLTYYCICQLDPRIEGITKIGLILPAQKRVVRVDLSDWEWAGYWEYMTNAKSEKESNVLDGGDVVVWALIRPYVGNHLCKGKHHATTLMEAHSRFPYMNWQMFIGGRQTSTISKATGTEAYIAKVLEANQYLNRNGVGCYVHLPYIYNPCWSSKGEMTTRGMVNYYQSAIDHITISVKMGMRGCVVHTGKHQPSKGKFLDLTVKKGLKRMRKWFLTMFEYATEECPVLLETCCGSGSELCASPEDFISFCNQFKDEKRFGVCLDTCHVHCAGYDCFDFYSKLIEAGVNLRLIHYNDSRKEFGCGSDGHAPIGHGLVNFTSLMKVGGDALRRGIAMVYE